MLAYKRVPSAAITTFRFCSLPTSSLLSPTASLPHIIHKHRQPIHRQQQPRHSFSTTRSQMMSNTTLPIPTEASSDVLSQAVAQKDSSYKFLYFNLHGRGELIRNLLAYGGHKWEELPVDWANQKSKTQFQCIPVVWETTSSGTILELAESLAIERYLAKKFNLLGKNAWEEHKVNEYYNSTDGAQQSYAIKVLNGPHENRVEEANKYYTEVLGKFITLHEQHLAKNGANGHYVGHQTSLADLKTAMLIDRLLLLRPKGAHEVPFSKEKTPNLWKVRETVNSHPSMAEWRHSQRFKELDAGTKQIFKMADEN